MYIYSHTLVVLVFLHTASRIIGIVIILIHLASLLIWTDFQNQILRTSECWWYVYHRWILVCHCKKLSKFKGKMALSVCLHSGSSIPGYKSMSWLPFLLFQTIVLWSCRHISENGLLELVDKCHKLKSMNLWGTRVPVDCLNNLLVLRPTLRIKV